MRDATRSLPQRRARGRRRTSHAPRSASMPLVAPPPPAEQAPPSSAFGSRHSSGSGTVDPAPASGRHGSPSSAGPASGGGQRTCTSPHVPTTRSHPGGTTGSGRSAQRHASPSHVSPYSHSHPQRPFALQNCPLGQSACDSHAIAGWSGSPEHARTGVPASLQACATAASSVKRTRNEKRAGTIRVMREPLRTRRATGARFAIDAVGPLGSQRHTLVSSRPRSSPAPRARSRVTPRGTLPDLSGLREVSWARHPRDARSPSFF